MSDSARERIDIAFVRARTGMSHVSDPDALTEFTSGRGVFDVDPHCRKLDTFVEKHRIEAIITSEDLLPCADPRELSSVDRPIVTSPKK